MTLVIRNARLLTLRGPGPRRGPGLGDLAVIDRGYLVVEGDRIAALGEGAPPPRDGIARTIDARGRVLMPGFVDAHTHACWAGERLEEWERKLAGLSYLEILRSGGGILATVRATRQASQAELAELLGRRLQAALVSGTTSIEVKSGYGLSTRDELKMLRAIRDAGRAAAPTVIPTACLGHAIDPGHPGGPRGFVDQVIEETLPAVHEEFPGIAVDAFCEEGAWSFEDVTRLFERAAALGHPLRVHADQFHELGMLPWAVAHGLRSVDHLEATGPQGLRCLAGSDVQAVLLPCSGFHTDGRYAPGRALLDLGVSPVIASNWNPGSAPCGSIPMALALARRHLGFSAAEAIAAATLNAARLLGLEDRGSLAPGQRADLVLLRHTDERELVHEFGPSPVDLVVCGGEPVPAFSP